MNLRETQREILAAIRNRSPSPALQQAIINGRGLDAQRCLKIHHQTWLGARMEVLKSVFPVCRQIVGDECFRQLARNCALACPSVHPNLHCYPVHFAAWLEEWIKDRSEFADFTYLADLARLEWARYRTWETGNNESFDFTAFAALDAQQQTGVRFRLDEAASLVETPYPVLETWQLHQTDTPQSILTAGHLPEHLLVYRTPSGPSVECLDEHAAEIYRRLAQGVPLAALQAAADAMDFALDGFIQHLIELGCITSFELSDNPVAPAAPADNI